MSHWIGRFAPTPSGPLHFGSLVAALGSYVIARQQQGQWLLRIEDLDPPREQPGAADSIIRTLETFGFEWDGEIQYQSRRTDYYHQILAELERLGITYFCDCSRKQVQVRNEGIYDGFCRQRKLHTGEFAIRVRFSEAFTSFVDQVQGVCCFDSAEDRQDFVVYRRDKLFAYQLAVVADDIEQKVNQVVRGADILDSTPRQNFLYHCLGKAAPQYFHLPLVVDINGQKFSKSKLYPAIEPAKASGLLVKALEHLGQVTVPDLATGTPQEILRYAVSNWQLSRVGKSPKMVAMTPLTD